MTTELRAFFYLTRKRILREAMNDIDRDMTYSGEAWKRIMASGKRGTCMPVWIEKGLLCVVARKNKKKNVVATTRVEYLSMRELEALTVLPDVFQHRETLKEATVREYATCYMNGEELLSLTVAEIGDSLFLSYG